MSALVLALATFSLASCNDDEDIAYTLSGGWEGNMYVQSSYNGYSYQATESVLYFDKDPYEYATGAGYWIDYYSNAPWDYFSSRITWRVYGGEIQIYSESEGVTYYISDYSLNHNNFCGYISDGSRFSNPVYFELHRTGWNSNWDSYGWNGYNYRSGYRYAPGTDTQKSSQPTRGIKKD